MSRYYKISQHFGRMISRIKPLFDHPRTWLFLYLILALISYIQLLVTGKYNNFSIFRHSSYHLLEGLPLYTGYPQEYFDLFYYNPVFPVLFMPFALLPIHVSLALWPFTTAICCYAIFRKIPLAGNKVNVFLLLILADLSNNLNHTQTNPFVLAFMLMVWILMEKEKQFWASMFIVLCFLIKGYGAIICLICLYYRNWYKMIFYGLFWMVAFNALLLLFVPLQTVIQYYSDWLQIISSDVIRENLSVYGILKNLHITLAEKYVQAAALVLLAVFMTLQLFNKERQSSHIVAFLLIWVVVFNRAAESPTYLIAIAGCILWYLSRPRTPVSSILFWTAILGSSIIPVEGIFRIFHELRHEYQLKSILSLLVMSDMFVYTLNCLRKNNALTYNPPESSC